MIWPFEFTREVKENLAFFLSVKHICTEVKWSSMVQTRSNMFQTRSSMVQTRMKWLSTGRVEVQTIKYGSDYSRILSSNFQTNSDWSSENLYSRIHILTISDFYWFVVYVEYMPLRQQPLAKKKKI